MQHVMKTDLASVERPPGATAGRVDIDFRYGFSYRRNATTALAGELKQK